MSYLKVSQSHDDALDLIETVPYRFTGLRTIGLIYFLLNIVFYILLWAMIITRFVFYPYLFKPSFTHPTESLFVPAFAVSFGTILINIVQYGFGEVGEWLNRAVVILFWFDATLAIILSILIYFILWSKQTFTIARMTPYLDIPSIPAADYWSACGHIVGEVVKSSRRDSSYSWWVYDTRNRLLGLVDNLLGLRVPTYDAEITAGTSATRYVR